MVVVKYWCPTGNNTARAVAFCALMLAWAGSVYAQGGDPEEALRDRLEGLDGIIAEFEQQVTSPRGVVIEQSSGTLYLLKPAFRWDVDDPYPQTILAREGVVHVYDPDLEQVTERALDDSLDQAPLALLTRSNLALSDYFKIVQLGSQPDVDRFELYPTGSDSLFARMQLVFDGRTLSALVIYDHVGQQTLVRFADYEPGQVIQSDVFEMRYPPDTDFVRG